MNNRNFPVKDSLQSRNEARVKGGGECRHEHCIMNTETRKTIIFQGLVRAIKHMIWRHKLSCLEKTEIRFRRAVKLIANKTQTYALSGVSRMTARRGSMLLLRTSRFRIASIDMLHTVYAIHDTKLQAHTHTTKFRKRRKPEEKLG